MPLDIHNDKWSCDSCVRGHRSTKCNHWERVMIRVNKPGRPLAHCPHAKGPRCPCRRDRCIMAMFRLEDRCVCVPQYKVDDNGAPIEPVPIEVRGPDGRPWPGNFSHPLSGPGHRGLMYTISPCGSLQPSNPQDMSGTARHHNPFYGPAPQGAQVPTMNGGQLMHFAQFQAPAPQFAIQQHPEVTDQATGVLTYALAPNVLPNVMRTWNGGPVHPSEQVYETSHGQMVGLPNRTRLAQPNADFAGPAGIHRNAPLNGYGNAVSNNHSSGFPNGQLSSPTSEALTRQSSDSGHSVKTEEDHVDFTMVPHIPTDYERQMLEQGDAALQPMLDYRGCPIAPFASTATQQGNGVDHSLLDPSLFAAPNQGSGLAIPELNGDGNTNHNVYGHGIGASQVPAMADGDDTTPSEACCGEHGISIHECHCGDNCSCYACPQHPANPTTLKQMASLERILAEDEAEDHAEAQEHAQEQSHATSVRNSSMDQTGPFSTPDGIEHGSYNPYPPTIAQQFNDNDGNASPTPIDSYNNQGGSFQNAPATYGQFQYTFTQNLANDELTGSGGMGAGMMTHFGHDSFNLPDTPFADEQFLIRSLRAAGPDEQFPLPSAEFSEFFNDSLVEDPEDKEPAENTSVSAPAPKKQKRTR